VEDITEIEEARHLTRRGRHFKPTYLEEDYPRRDPPPTWEADKAKALKETEENQALAQLKKTQASISIWGLIMASQKHRDAILESLGWERSSYGYYTRANTVYHGCNHR
jgi:hypothetical protein